MFENPETERQTERQGQRETERQRETETERQRVRQCVFLLGISLGLWENICLGVSSKH